MKKKTTIEKLDNSLPEDWKEEAYEQAKKDYIAKFEEYHSGGFLSTGSWILNPAAGEAKWNSWYPRGYKSWLSGQGISTEFILEMVDKINELVDKVSLLEQQ